MAWENPKLDWLTNPVNPTKTDMNRIESNINFINTDIETKKGAIVNALVDVGIATTLTDTHAQIATKITTAEKTGISITPSTVNQAIPKGIYNTNGGLVVGDPDLIAGNIVPNKNIFGVVGTFSFISKIKTYYNHSKINPITISLGTTFNLANSIIITRFTSKDRSDSSTGMKSVYFASTSSITINKTGSVYMGVHITVIEFNPSIVKSIQRGDAIIADGTTVTIASINTAKSLLFVAGGQNVFSSGLSNSDPTSILIGGYGTLQSATSIVFLDNNYSTSTTIGHWQVIEFY